MIVKSISSSAPKVAAAINGRIMFSDSRIETILLKLKPGELLPLHTNPYDVLFAGISGEAVLTSQDSDYSIKPGETIYVSADEARGWENNSSRPCQIMVIKILNPPSQSSNLQPQNP